MILGPGHGHIDVCIRARVHVLNRVVHDVALDVVVERMSVAHASLGVFVKGKVTTLLLTPGGQGLRECDGRRRAVLSRSGNGNGAAAGRCG